MKTEKCICSICGNPTGLTEKDLDSCLKVCSEDCSDEAIIRMKMGANEILYKIIAPLPLST